ncbi:DNA gyrase subunit A [bacterium AB1]|nr:DNA gyrase subunit A [bacterium AB1]
MNKKKQNSFLEKEDKEIFDIDFVEELSSSYAEYAISVISNRAIPDIRDGLKAVQRRIIYSMYESNNTHNYRFRKCAYIIGLVSGKYHAHGEVAIYDTMVRMAQTFSTNMPLISSQGNFGSIDGDEAAAQRYTEARLSQITSYIIDDLNYNIIEMSKTYDGSYYEPNYLPFKIPVSIINGNSGIAVCFASCIPPHNPIEVIDALLHMIKKNNYEDTKTDEIMNFIPGPDFPVKCIVNSKNLKELYETGKNIININAPLEYVEEINAIVITGIPYTIKKIKLIKSIYERMQTNDIVGISDIVDESGENNINIKILLKPNQSHEVIIRRLYKYTDCSISLGCSFRFIANKKPQIIPLVECLVNFLDNRTQIIKNRLQLEIISATKDIEKIIALFIVTKTKKIIDFIKRVLNNASIQETRQELKKLTFDITEIAEYLPYNKEKINLKKFQLSALQIEYLLSTQIIKLNQEKTNELINVLKEKSSIINKNKNYLNHPNNINSIIEEELTKCRKILKDCKRNCPIKDIELIKKDKNLYNEEHVIILLCPQNTILFKELKLFKTQKRGGKGKDVSIEYKVIKAIQCTTHEDILIFTKLGYAFKINTVLLYYENKKINELISIKENDEIISLSKLNYSEENNIIVIVTEKGYIKKHGMKELIFAHKGGKKIYNISNDDKICKILTGSSGSLVSLFTQCGRSITIELDEIRELSTYNTVGVIGIKLKNEDLLQDAILTKKGEDLLIINSNGNGKIFSNDDIKINHRNTTGINFINKKHGQLISVTVLSKEENNNILIITSSGKTIIFETIDIRTTKRLAKGVKLINLDDHDSIVFSSKI